MLNFNDLKKVFSDTDFYNFTDELEILRVEHDTRKNLNKALYIALKGANFDGHCFLEDAYKNGAAASLVEKINKNIKMPQVLVPSSEEAYLQLAKYYRNKLKAKIIAVTGSNGKTTSKDLIFHILKKFYKVYKNEGNLNNQIGLPYSLLNVPLDAEFVILEMGMNALGEIKKLSETASPNYALITNIGSAHIGKLGSMENILKAKLELFDFVDKNEGTIFFNIYDNNLLKVRNTYKNIVDFIKISNISDGVFSFVVNKKTYQGNTLLKGKHNLINISAALTVAKFLNLDINTCLDQIKTFNTGSMRFEMLKKDSIVFILDCYNANPESMRALIEYASSLKAKRTVAVIGNMNELDDYEKKYHIEIGTLLKEKNINKVFSFGSLSKYYKLAYNDDEQFSDLSNHSNSEAVNIIKNELKEGDLVFFKASRSIRLEDIYKGVIA